MVLKQSAAAVIATAGLLAAAAQAEPLQDRLESAYERILSKNGVEIAGKISAEYLNSSLDGSAVIDTLYSYETTQFTAFDLDMQYRPYDFISARADFRFYQDWQTFFSTRSRILTARWLSVDGNLGNMLGFNVGDFRQKYSPLTVWTPGLDLIYEPLVFSRRRAELMEEQYLDGNDRNLQGVNLNFAKRFESPLTEVRLDGIVSRLRRAEFLDRNGAHGNGQDRSDMDRFFFAANGEGLVMDNLLLGGTFLRTADDRESFEQFIMSEALRNDIGNQDPTLLPPDGRSLNGRDAVIARDLTVTGAHAGLDAGGFIGSKQLTLDLLVDYAKSSESNKYAWAFTRDTSGKLHASEKSAPGLDGSAWHVELGTGWQGSDSAYGVRLTARQLNNEAAFQNPLAQSPSFSPQRILNTENDFAAGALYSTFDALNNGVYKFTPSRRGPTYQQAPFTKSSYDNAILSPEDLAAFSGDAALQLALPFGLATPNRKGTTLRLLGHWQNAVHVTVDAALLEQFEGVDLDSVRAAPAKITQMGGGIKVEIGSLLERELPLDVSASFVRGQSKRDRTAKDLANPEITSDLVMAGLYYRFLPKWSLLGGFQQAASKLPNGLIASRTDLVGNQFDLDITQHNYRVGVEYALTLSAYLMLSGGVNSYEATRTHMGSLPATASGAVGPANPALSGSADFSQTVVQALINVKF